MAALWLLFCYKVYKCVIRICCCCLVAKFCLTLWDSVDCILPGSSAHGISQARILEWVAISFSMGASWLRDWTCVSCIAGEFFTTEPLGKPIIKITRPIARIHVLSIGRIFIWHLSISQVRKYIEKHIYKHTHICIHIHCLDPKQALSLPSFLI